MYGEAVVVKKRNEERRQKWGKWGNGEEIEEIENLSDFFNCNYAVRYTLYAILLKPTYGRRRPAVCQGQRTAGPVRG